MMNSNKQVKMNCIRLNLVRTKEEKGYGNLRNSIEQRKYSFRKGLSNYVKKELKVDNWTEDCGELFKKIITNSKRYIQIEKELKQVKKKIHELYVVNKNLNRSVKSKDIKTKDIIAIGDNNLVRTLKLDLGSFTDKLITVKCGDMDNIVIDKIIKDGLTIRTTNDDVVINVKYKFFTAGAGQTRNKKFMMIKADEDLSEVMLTLMCGLTIEEINEKGGMNISKFLAYLSLNNSASKVWQWFDIDKCIVVDDFETLVSANVDYIDRKVNIEEYKDKANKNRTKPVATWNIIKDKKMNVPVPHFDGLGIMLPSLCSKNRQIRLPWLKGLVTPFDYVSWIEEHKYSSIVKDIYEKEYDVIKDDIQIIFTKSQFKLWKFYNSWEDYKNKFKTYNCTANICMEDEDIFEDMCINYQMLQQLVNMKDEHIDILTKDFKRLIDRVHTDRNSQLEFLGATNKKRNYFQEALRLYPEMLKSAYVKKQIENTITKAKKDAASGRIKIKGSRRMFILSDPTAFCDWLFGGIEVPEGYLKDGEVYCNLFEKSEELDVLRSPSLSFEHAVRTNIRATKECKWFITNGIYTSTKDVISKILAFDVDGDEALVLGKDSHWIIDLAKEMIEEHKIRPIYFEMSKAEAKEITNSNISESLLFVYKKANIGKVSNVLTRIWNKENPMKEYNLMQKLCAHNNDVIDSAKTLDIPKLPSDVKESITIGKYPYFFQYAKEKKELQCLPASNSTMDRICREIESIGNKKFDYSKSFGAFKVKILMFDQNNFEVDKNIIEKYLELEERTRKEINDYSRTMDSEDDEDMKKTDFKSDFYSNARAEFEQWSNENNLELLKVIDHIIKYTYKTNALKMKFLWNVFGQEIINNININVRKPLDKGHIMCVDCGTRVKKESNNQIRCKKCASKKSHKKSKGDSEKAS
ncbi:hypothetical protein JHL18_00675 [Clostridium sp. YIM B02505]|uniref:Uncharacterized protein n=1 Tax=Clostridium yunnanense TaxID=2800325 RepID=A0ABS1EII8_9CLOT|nr:hypothetical protein [Clostridium yunnanense]MBK1809162.1 hypothetical protein [Clostridium yunnanense]